MSPIQIVLILAALLWLTRFFRGVGGGSAARALALLAFGGGIVLVAFPELSTKLAAMLGVKRGADLVLYLSIVVLGLLWLNQASRLKEFERKLTQLVRDAALRGGSEGSAPAAPEKKPPAAG
jgi:hypothetical protein